MIRNDSEHRKAVDRIKAERERIDAMRAQLAEEGLSDDEVKRATDPVQSFHLQLVEEVEAYEQLKRGEFGELENFRGLGQMLIAFRIYRGLSQRALADRLGIHESQVSRDERNEYHGITVGRAEKILRVLGVRVSSRVDFIEPQENDEIAV